MLQIVAGRSIQSRREKQETREVLGYAAIEGKGELKARPGGGCIQPRWALARSSGAHRRSMAMCAITSDAVPQCDYGWVWRGNCVRTAVERRRWQSLAVLWMLLGLEGRWDIDLWRLRASQCRMRRRTSSRMFWIEAIDGAWIETVELGRCRSPFWSWRTGTSSRRRISPDVEKNACRCRLAPAFEVAALKWPCGSNERVFQTSILGPAGRVTANLYAADEPDHARRGICPSLRETRWACLNGSRTARPTKYNIKHLRQGTRRMWRPILQQ